MYRIHILKIWLDSVMAVLLHCMLMMCSAWSCVTY